MKRIQLFVPDNIYATLIEHKTNTKESMSKIARDIFELGYSSWRQDNLTKANAEPRPLLDSERIAIMASAESLILLRKIAETIDTGIVENARKEAQAFMRDKWVASKK